MKREVVLLALASAVSVVIWLVVDFAPVQQSDLAAHHDVDLLQWRENFHMASWVIFTAWLGLATSSLRWIPIHLAAFVGLRQIAQLAAAATVWDGVFGHDISIDMDGFWQHFFVSTFLAWLLLLALGSMAYVLKRTGVIGYRCLTGRCSCRPGFLSLIVRR